MSLWTHLLRRSCSHQFGWPRVHADGRHYQICSLCGIAFEYDWATMCRTDRVMIVGAPQISEDNRVVQSAPLPKRQD